MPLGRVGSAGFPLIDDDTHEPLVGVTAAGRAGGPAGGTEAVNVVLMLGTLVRDPEIRALPSGDVLASFDLTTRAEDEPTASAPVVWFEPPEAARATLSAGEAVVVVGWVRRRFFRSGGATQSRTEVVARRVVPVRQAKRAQAAVDQAIAGIAAVSADGPGR